MFLGECSLGKLADDPVLTKTQTGESLIVIVTSGLFTLFTSFWYRNQRYRASPSSDRVWSIYSLPSGTGTKGTEPHPRQTECGPSVHFLLVQGPKVQIITLVRLSVVHLFTSIWYRDQRYRSSPSSYWVWSICSLPSGTGTKDTDHHHRQTECGPSVHFLLVQGPKVQIITLVRLSVVHLFTSFWYRDQRYRASSSSD